MRKINLLVSLLLTLSFILPQTAFGIGQMTKPIILENVLRGQVIEETLTLYGSEEKEVNFGLSAEGGIKDWATFYLPDDLENPITKIQIPAKSHIDVIVRFRVPEDTPNGAYTGTVAIFSQPEENKGEGISTSVGLRVDREVSITVTDQEIIKLDTAIIPLKYKVEKGEPLQIKIIHDNQGNVSVEPDIQLKITKEGKKVFNAIFPYPEDENPVKPLERKTLSSLIEWQTTGQENGEYKAEIKVLLNGEEKQKEDFRFTAVGDGIVAGTERSAGKSNVDKFLDALSAIGRGNPTVGWLVIGGIFLIIAEILITINRRKRRS